MSRLSEFRQWLRNPYLKYIVLIPLLLFALFQTIYASVPFPFTSSFCFLKLTIASFIVLILPGYLILNLLRPRTTGDLLESIVLSLGTSFILMQSLCILTFELQLNSSKAIVILLGICSVLMVFGFLREKRAGLRHNEATTAEAHHKLIFVIMVVAIIATTLLLYRIESPPIRGEDQLHVSIIRKIAENDVIQKENIMYRLNMPHPYLYPGLHFASALISKVSAIDPIIVYTKFRYILGFLSLIIIYTFSKSLFKSRYISSIATCTCIALIYSGVAARIPGYYCGQLVPVSHITDICMAILLPLSLIFTFKYISFDSRILNRFAILAPLLMLTTTIIHVHESFEILFYYLVTLMAFLIFKRHDKQVIWKMAFLICSVILLGLIYMPIHHGNVGYIWQEIELPKKQVAVDALIHVVTGPFTAAFEPGDTSGLGWKGLPHVSLALFLAPVILFWFRKYFWGLFLGSSILASFLIIRFEILTVLAMMLTYSSIVNSPVRFVLFFSYIIFGLLVFANVAIFENIFTRVRRFAKNRLSLFGLAGGFLIGLYLCSRYVFLPLMGVIETGIYFHGGILFAAWVILLGILSYLRFFDRIVARFREMFHNYKPGFPNFSILILLSLLLAIYFFGGINGQGLVKEYENRTLPDITNFEDYYRSARFSNIPLDLVEYIRREVEPHNIFAYNLKAKKICIPLVSNQFILVGSRMGTGQSDADYLSDSFRDGEQIIFNENEPVEDKLNYIYRFNFTYILLDPEYYSLSDTFGGYSCFKEVYDDGDFALFKIDREQLQLTLLNWEE